MIAGSRPALNRVAWEAGFLTHNFCTSNSFTHNSGAQLVHAQAHTQLFHNFLTKNSFTHNCFTLIHHNVLTHFSHTQLFHIQLLYLSILHHLPCLSSLPRPASTSVLIIGRSWLVGLSGPLFVFLTFPGNLFQNHCGIGGCFGQGPSTSPEAYAFEVPKTIFMLKDSSKRVWFRAHLTSFFGSVFVCSTRDSGAMLTHFLACDPRQFCVFDACPMHPATPGWRRSRKSGGGCREFLKDSLKTCWRNDNELGYFFIFWNSLWLLPVQSKGLS